MPQLKHGDLTHFPEIEEEGAMKKNDLDSFIGCVFLMALICRDICH
jgi:hypothetical protein